MIASLHDRHTFLTEGTLAADSAGHEVHKMYERSHIVLAGAGCIYRGSALSVAKAVVWYWYIPTSAVFCRISASNFPIW